MDEQCNQDDVLCTCIVTSRHIQFFDVCEVVNYCHVVMYMLFNGYYALRMYLSFAQLLTM